MPILESDCRHSGWEYDYCQHLNRGAAWWRTISVEYQLFARHYAVISLSPKYWKSMGLVICRVFYEQGLLIIGTSW